MFQDIWKMAKRLVTLADDVQKYRAEIKEIREEIRDLTILVYGLAQDIKHSKERAASQHEKLLLELENRLLKLEPKLPPAGSVRKQLTKRSSSKKTSKNRGKQS